MTKPAKGAPFFLLFLKVSFCLIFLTLASLPRSLGQPPATHVGSEEEAFRKEGRVEVPEERKKPEIETRLEEAAEEEAPEREFFIRTIEVVGNTRLPQAEIRALVMPYENRALTLNLLKECARKITQAYRARGYLTSRAYVPAQRIENERARIEVIEGRVGKIRVERNRFFRKKSIRREMTTEEGEILEYQKLELDLIRLNRNPDREVRAVLLPGEQPGTTDIVLTVKDRIPLHPGYDFDNQGTKFTGLLRQGVSFVDNNLLGLDDRLSNRFQMSRQGNFVGLGIGYELPLRGSATQLEVGYSFVNTQLGKQFRTDKVKGEAQAVTASLSQRFLETSRFEGLMIAGFDFKEIETSRRDRDSNRDNLRILRLGPQGIETDGWGRFLVTSQFHMGFSSLLGASDREDVNASRAGAGGQFFYWDLAMARLQKLWASSYFILRASTQLSGDKLVRSEQYRLGGADTVRGYPEGDFLADYGFFTSGEVHLPFYVIPEDWKIPFTDKSLRQSIEMVGFVDLGKGFLKGPLVTEDKRAFLMSLGGGLRVRLLRRLNLHCDWGVPVADKSAEGKGVRFHFSIHTEL